MERKLKLFVIDRTPYVCEDTNVIIGDKAIVSVNDMFPSILDCQNEEQIRLIQEPKLSMTKRYKLIEDYDVSKITDEMIDLVIQTERAINIIETNGEVKINQV
jgi:hypothetical protein